MGIEGHRPATKRWVRERARIYAQRVSLPSFPRRRWPVVVFSYAEARRVGTTLSRSFLTSYGTKAACDKTQGIIVIFLDRQACVHHRDFCRSYADDSVAHEVVHLRWRTLSCQSDVFDRRVAALRAGARCGSKGSRLPKELH